MTGRAAADQHNRSKNQQTWQQVTFHSVSPE